jgi:DNA primase
MAGMVPKKVLEDIRFKSDVVDVIGSYITVKKAGATFKALCPFHKEKTPSFVVNPARQIFHCFGCGEGGDVFKFVMLHEAMDFMSAVQVLADRAGVKLEFDGTKGERGPDKTVFYSMLEEVAQFYQRILLTSDAAKQARAYLEKRKITEETIKDFLIGYVPDRWDSVIIWAKKHKYSTKQLETVGLVVQSSKPGKASQYYDRFRGRIMFAIRDTQSRIIGFSGRTMKSDAKEAKYVNSPETLLFHKSRALYGLYRARREIVEKREAIICEGQIDVIRCHQSGIKNAIAAQGTAFTEDHARIVTRSTDSAVIAFDSDTAGKNAAIKSAVIFIRSGLAVRIAQLPEEEDPDSFILKNGPEAFRSLCNDAVSAVKFQIDLLKLRHDASTEAGISRITNEVLDTIGQAPDPVHRDSMTKEASELLGLTTRVLSDSLRQRARRRQPPQEADDARQERSPKAGSEPREELALAEHVVAEPALTELVTKYLPMRMLTGAMCKSIVEAAIEAVKHDKDLMSVVSDGDDPERRLSSFAARLQMIPSKADGKDFSHEGATKEAILYIRRREVKRERAKMEAKMKESKGSGDKKVRREHAELTSDLKALQNWETALPILQLEE